MSILGIWCNFDHIPMEIFYNVTQKWVDFLQWNCRWHNSLMKIYLCIFFLGYINLICIYDPLDISICCLVGECDWMHLWTTVGHGKDGCWPSQIARFMGPTWGPPGSCRPQVGPMLAPWTLLFGLDPLVKLLLQCRLIVIRTNIGPSLSTTLTISPE